MTALQATEHRANPPVLFRDDNVRGVYLNELGPREAERLAAALAGVLWQRQPRRCSDPVAFANSTVLPAGSGRHVTDPMMPTVVLGYDDRPAAAALALAAATGLRQMSCQVIDIGLTSRPGFWFAAHHLQSTAGVFVSGSGCGPAWQGLEFVSREALPIGRGVPAVDHSLTGPPAEHNELSHEQLHDEAIHARMSLDDIAAGFRNAPARPSRQGGRQRNFPIQAAYTASLQRHFHALRPLTVCVGCSSSFILQTLSALFRNLPVEIMPLTLPVRPRRLMQSGDPDVQKLSQSVTGHMADFGLLIDDDGQRCLFIAEDGRPLSTTVTTSLLADVVRQEHPGGLVLLESDSPPRLFDLLSQRGFRCRRAAGQLAEMAVLLRVQHAYFAGGASGRYWFREAFPTSDAILTLARMLTALSQHDQPLSAFARRHV